MFTHRELRSSSWQSQSQLVRNLSLLAAIIAIIVAASAPAGFFWLSYRAEAKETVVAARLHAAFVTQVASTSQQWQQEVPILIEADLAPSDLPEVRTIRNVAGREIASTGPPMSYPTVSGDAMVMGRNGRVGTVTVTRSIKPVLLSTLLVAALGTAFGLAIFGTLRVLPLRALRRTLEALRQEANYDSLTGLPNRVLFRDRLLQAMERAERGNRCMALMFLDLDRFKVVNDSLGHEVGDLLLMHVAKLLARTLRGTDTIARSAPETAFTVSRLGGDEFTIIVDGITDSSKAAYIAERILKELATPFIHDSQEIYISTSIGISLYPAGNTDLDSLIRQADLAMYRSKELGRNTYNFFNEEMNVAIAARIDLEASLRHALERGEFILHYQPKVSLSTGAVSGVEALIRWNRPDLGMVAPDVFIAALEDTGMIVPVGAWVIQTACAEIASWDRLGLPPLSLAVNLSARQFRQQDLAEMIGATLRSTGLPAQRLELELTESLLMEDNELSSSVLAKFGRMGLRVAIDDFGTGHSSLSYLKRFSVNTLKIDRSFVRDTPGDLDDCAIATAVVALAHSLNLNVVAEGVETAEQLTFLRGLGCDEIQGYLVSRPLAPIQFIAWIKSYSTPEADSAWFKRG